MTKTYTEQDIREAFRKGVYAGRRRALDSMYGFFRKMDHDWSCDERMDTEWRKIHDIVSIDIPKNQNE